LSQFGINLPPVPALSGGSGATTTGLTSPGLGTGLGTTGLTSPGLSSPGLTPGLTSPSALAPTTAGGGVASPAAGLNPALTSPGLTSPAGRLGGGAGGTYPILGDPPTPGGGAPGGGGGSGGLVNDVMQAANQLGAGQAIDLLKGLVMPAIQQAAQNGGAPGALP